MKCLTLCVALSLVPLCVPVEAQRAVPTPIADSVARVMATPSHWPDRGIFAPPDEPVTARQPLPTGRVRITAAAGIELSTLMQLVLGSATETVRWEVVAEDGDTVTARVGLQPPSTVLRSGHRVEGVISEAGTALLTITTPTGTSVVVPRQFVARYERSEGRRSRGRGALWGVLIGAGAGALVGYGYGSGCESSGGFDLSCAGEPAASAAAGVVVGGGAGALAGALLPRPERWAVIPIAGLP